MFELGVTRAGVHCFLVTLWLLNDSWIFVFDENMLDKSYSDGSRGGGALVAAAPQVSKQILTSGRGASPLDPGAVPGLNKSWIRF